MEYRVVEAGDLTRVADLERRSYPADEAASPATLEDRIRRAPGCFLVALDSTATIQGFVCGTRSREPHLVAASMREHHPDGASLCIHSVVVSPDRRRTGVGTRLMRAYVDHVRRSSTDVEVLLLICKEHLIPFYGEAGFNLVGPSVVVHGEDPWFEMRQTL